MEKCDPSKPEHRLLLDVIALNPEWALERMLFLENEVTRILKGGAV